MLLVTTLRVGYCQDAILPVASAAWSGVSGYGVALPHGRFVRAQATRSIVQGDRAVLAAAARDKPTQTHFPSLGMVPVLDTAEEFARIVSDPQERLMPWPKTSI
jgi:hypothetical protein